MNKKNGKVVIIFCTAIFAVLGIYFTFISGNTSKYDSEVKAYSINPNERYDSDDGYMYQPIYYFKVNDKKYECEAKISSSFYPDENKNTVYFDSSDPTKCLTEYEKSSGSLAGIFCLIVTGIIVYFGFIKKPTNNKPNTSEVINNAGQMAINPEQVEKIAATVDKVSLIIKRVILGVIIFVLLLMVLFDTGLFVQTMKSKDYIETTAEYVERKSSSDDSVFDDRIYTFKDKEGNDHEITITLAKDTPSDTQIKIRYDENNPQEFYEEGSTLDKTGMIIYIVKAVVLLLLIFLFFNKKLLSKVNISAG